MTAGTFTVTATVTRGLEAVAINNNGQTVAYCKGPGVLESGAVVWTNGTPA